MSKFKVGDRVKVTGKRASGSRDLYGKICTVTDAHDDWCKVDNLENGGIWDEDLTLVGKNGKVLKPVPIDRHVVIEDSCLNNHGVYDSYDRAVEKAKEINEDTTVYKMVEVATVTNEKRVKKKRK